MNVLCKHYNAKHFAAEKVFNKGNSFEMMEEKFNHQRELLGNDTEPELQLLSI